MTRTHQNFDTDDLQTRQRRRRFGSGPYSETVAARLREIGNDEILHAEKLRARILALGGTPTMEVSTEDLKPASTLEEILSINIAEEKGAVQAYGEILESLSMTNVILFQTVQEILRDEQEHLEELDALRQTKLQADPSGAMLSRMPSMRSSSP